MFLPWVQYVPIFHSEGLTIYILISLFHNCAASIATTGIRSDAPAEHAQYQGWNIEKDSTPTERFDWSVIRAPM